MSSLLEAIERRLSSSKLLARWSTRSRNISGYRIGRQPVVLSPPSVGQSAKNPTTSNNCCVSISRSTRFFIMTENVEEFYEVALKLVREAGDIIKDKINRPKDVMVKSCDVDLVTESDQQVEKLFMSGITASFPDHRFIGEETTSSGAKVQLTDSPTWVIDPIDGTMNFVHGLPHTCISVALLIEKVTEIGIVYNPVLEQLFTAKRGQGAFLNGEPIKVSGEKELGKALLMTEMGTSRDLAKMKIVFENLQILIPKVHGTRALGSAALNMCMVAMGGADVNFECGIHIWDFSAGDLIVREAGGVCIDPAGGAFDNLSGRVLCASSMELAQEVSSLLVQYYPPRD